MSEHRVASLAGLEQDVPTDVDAGGTEILLVRRGDAVHALAARCPHRGVPLSKGIVDGDRIVCGVHRAAFDLATGELLAPPACESLARYEVRIDGDDVHVEVPAGAEAHPLPAMAKRGTDARRFVVVGSGGAGWRAAETLRREGFEGAITVVTDEGGEPYDRTELSKSYLKPSEGNGPEAPVLRTRAVAEAHDIDVVVGTAAGLDVDAKRLRLDGAPVDALDYDALLVATGADARTLDVPGADLEGVHVVRTLEDAKALRKDLEGCRSRVDGKRPVRAVVVGAGFVGLEAATSLSAHDDVEVTVTMPDELPMVDKFGEDFGRRLKAEHEDAGVTFRTGGQTDAFEADGDRVARVKLDDGSTLDADLVVVAVGAAPRTGWLPFDTADDGGVTVDAQLRAPGADGVWLAGDIARVPTAWGEARIEHWRFAQECGEIAARNMLGGEATYTGTPFFWSAQQIAGSYMMTGHVSGEPELEGDVKPDDFRLHFVEQGKLAAVLSHGIDDDVTRLVPRMAGTGPVPVEGSA